MPHADLLDDQSTQALPTRRVTVTFRPAHTIGPYLLLAELGGALFGGSAAPAEERITPEAIDRKRLV